MFDDEAERKKEMAAERARQQQERLKQVRAWRLHCALACSRPPRRVRSRTSVLGP